VGRRNSSPFEHIPQLRQLVEAGSAEKRPDASDSLEVQQQLTCRIYCVFVMVGISAFEHPASRPSRLWRRMTGRPHLRCDYAGTTPLVAHDGKDGGRAQYVMARLRSRERDRVPSAASGADLRIPRRWPGAPSSPEMFLYTPSTSDSVSRASLVLGVFLTVLP